MPFKKNGKSSQVNILILDSICWFSDNAQRIINFYELSTIHAINFTTLSTIHAFSFWLKIKNRESEHIEKKYIAINCMRFKKNGKSSQVNILILDFYLLELSNYKQMKILKKKLMKNFLHKLKIKSKNLQVNHHEISQKSNTVLISHHMSQPRCPDLPLTVSRRSP